MAKKRRAILLACGALLSITGCSAQVGDKQRFVADMIEQIKQRLPGVEVTQRDDPLSVSLKGGGRAQITLNFHRIYGFCRHASVEVCTATRSAFLDKVVRNPVPPAPTVASLRIAVHSAEYMKHVPAHVAEPIGDDLFAVLVSNAPDSVSTVPPEALVKLGLNREQAWMRALRQTRAQLPALPDPARLARGVVVYQDQPYLASLLTDAKGWAAVSETAGPDFLLTVVADDYVFVGRMPDGPRLEQFKQSVREDCASRQRCLSPNVYRFHDGRWVISR
ncbi:hypothetical protein [Sphingomonas sp. KR3-1]|uniref:hypothetical protein n=1 Tax=Sphingomonas sp. KR3-1 TaxID=3156611 RepID=UPI0032B548F6